MSIAVQIYAIDKPLFEGEADALTLPGTDGEFGVLPVHIPLISSLRRGIIRIRRGKEESSIAVNGGFVEVRPGSKVVVLANGGQQ